MPQKQSSIAALGALVLAGSAYVGALAILLTRVLSVTATGLFSRKRPFRWSALSGQMIRVGVKSLAIVMLVQFFLGAILSMQLTPPLADPWNQQEQVARIIGVAGFRMLGPIITAVVLTGFAGASIAAELGTMVVSEEIEAMEAMAMNPIRFLVVPRVLATFFSMIFLTVAANVMIAMGGYLTTRLALGPEYMGYFARMNDQLVYSDFITGLIMAGVFGLLISLIACHEGLRVRGGAEGVGRATTMTVVFSVVGIIGSAGVFTTVFYVFEW